MDSMEDFTDLGNPKEELARRDELAERLRWLLGMRWIALACVFVAIIGAHSFQIVAFAWPLYLVAALMLAFNLGFYRLHGLPMERSLRALSAEALMQIAVDILGLGLLLLFSGGLTNPFVFFFTHHVVISAILLDHRKAYSVAGFTTLVVALLWLAEQSGWFTAFGLKVSLVTPLPQPGLAHLGLVFVLGTTLVFSAYVVASLVARLRGRNREVRRLNADLAERVELLAKAEHKLSIEHRRAQAILECMEEGVVVVDLTGQVVRSNSAARKTALDSLDETLGRAGVVVEANELKAVSASETEKRNPLEPCPLIGAPCLHDLTDENGKLSPDGLAYLGADPVLPQDAAHVKRLRLPEEPRLVELELGGIQFENTVSTVRTAENETLGLVVVSRDVTERRSLQKQVLHGEKLHAVGNLAAGVAHELNTPLGTILGYAQMLLEDERSAGDRKELKVIEEQARRCRKIVQGMLAFARKSGSEHSAHQLEKLVDTAAELTAHTFQMRGISFLVDRPEQSLPPVLVSDNEIEQVLVNLLTNAGDAVGELDAEEMEKRGGGKVRVLLEYDASARQSVVAVEDNGPGVPEEIREQIFEPFYTTKEGGKGTGLGLSIATRIIEGHGGQLRLSQPAKGGPGTRFEIRLPVSTKSMKSDRSEVAA